MRHQIGDLVRHFTFTDWTGIVLETNEHPTDACFNRYYIKWFPKDSSSWGFEHELETI